MRIGHELTAKLALASVFAALGAVGLGCGGNDQKDKARPHSPALQNSGDLSLQATAFGRNAVHWRKEAEIFKDPSVDHGYTFVFEAPNEPDSVGGGGLQSRVAVSMLKRHGRFAIGGEDTYQVNADVTICYPDPSVDCTPVESASITQIDGQHWSALNNGKHIKPGDQAGIDATSHKIIDTFDSTWASGS